jgi:hypothetical protein
MCRFKEDWLVCVYGNQMKTPVKMNHPPATCFVSREAVVSERTRWQSFSLPKL